MHQEQDDHTKGQVKFVPPSRMLIPLNKAERGARDSRFGQRTDPVRAELHQFTGCIGVWMKCALSWLKNSGLIDEDIRRI
jgi:hypothetical protein